VIQKVVAASSTTHRAYPNSGISNQLGKGRSSCSPIRRRAVSAGQSGQAGFGEALQQLTGVLEYSGGTNIKVRLYG
jgi:hypothetical protein